MRGYDVCSTGEFRTRLVELIEQGVEGSLIKYEEGYDPLDVGNRLQGARWTVDPSLGEYRSCNVIGRRLIAPDPSLLSLVERLLPLASAYTSVEASLESRCVHSTLVEAAS